MSTKNDYQSPALLEIGSLHELTLQQVIVTKVGTDSDVLTSLGGGQGTITNVSQT